MAHGKEEERQLDQTPTWAVASICAIIIVISIVLEKTLHHVGEYFQNKKKKALFEALAKIKGELMILGFISLLLTFGQNYIANICIPNIFGNTMLPCAKRKHKPTHGALDTHEPKTAGEGEKGGHERRLLLYAQRMLSGDKVPTECEKGHVPLISTEALHQLHIFIFFLAVFHVIFSIVVMILGRLKTRGWKEWEQEAIRNQEVSAGGTAFKLTHEVSFVKDNATLWTRTPVLFFFACFFRQFFRSVHRSEYLSMRHAFISVHLAPGSKFDFQKYIKRSLEDDFKVVVGISPLLWASAVFFLLLNVDEWHAMSWLSIVPPVLILAVGTKLQAIIAQMAVEITEKHTAVEATPMVQVSDNYFWFAWPELILHLIHFVLFQETLSRLVRGKSMYILTPRPCLINAFEITYFFWIWYEFGLRSCFHRNFELTILRVALGFGVQGMCSYITLPLYALVTQMGTNMKQSIFDEHTSKALKKWHKSVKKKLGSSKHLSDNSSHTKENSSHASHEGSGHPPSEDSQHGGLQEEEGAPTNKDN